MVNFEDPCFGIIIIIIIITNIVADSQTSMDLIILNWSEIIVLH